MSGSFQILLRGFGVTFPCSLNFLKLISYSSCCKYLPIVSILTVIFYLKDSEVYPMMFYSPYEVFGYVFSDRFPVVFPDSWMLNMR